MNVNVNVMLYLMSVMRPPPNLCNLSVWHGSDGIYFGYFSFRCEMGFMECDDFSML